MRGTSKPMSWKDWVAVAGGLLVAFLLIAQLFVTIGWGGRLGPSPGLFVLGVAVLVMTAGTIFDRDGKRAYLNGVVKGLFMAALVLIVAGLLHLG
jgi:hypothetical protein